MFYQGGPIDHCTHVPGPVSQSSAESEYNSSFTAIMALVTTCKEELQIIIMLCVMTKKQNSRLDLMMYVSPTGGQSESSHFL